MLRGTTMESSCGRRSGTTGLPLAPSRARVGARGDLTMDRRQLLGFGPRVHPDWVQSPQPLHGPSVCKAFATLSRDRVHFLGGEDIDLETCAGLYRKPHPEPGSDSFSITLHHPSPDFPKLIGTPLRFEAPGRQFFGSPAHFLRRAAGDGVRGQVVLETWLWHLKMS